MSDLIRRRDNDFQLDHVGLGVPDTLEGVRWVQEQTGAEVELHDPEPDLWYWSGRVFFGENSYMEVIGPNPDWTKFQPFAAHIKSLPEPRLLFWFVGVTDFGSFQQLVHEKKTRLDRVEAVNVEPDSTARNRYRRGYIGPGFMSERPNVIQWLQNPKPVNTAGPVCKLTDFRLSNPQADKINSVFKDLGIEVVVAKGPSSIGITLDTPKGPWSIDNAGLDWTMPGILFKIAKLWWQTR